MPITPTWTWVYRDTLGNEIGETRRYDNGDEKQIIPYFIRSENGWEKGAAQKPRPIFGAELTTTTEDPRVAFVVEGEKCAAALQSLGLIAVSNQGGAHAAKDADWSPLKDFDRIYLLPDNNEAGETCMEDAARAIAAVGKAAFRICRIPGLPPGGDVVDWLQTQVADWNGLTPLPKTEELVASLRNLIKSTARPYYPSPQEQKPKTPPKDKDDHIADLRHALTFPAILAHYGKSTGGNQKPNGYCRCSSPFSSDSDPSFDYNSQIGIWHCFSTGKGGDVFNLIAALEGCSTTGKDFSRVISVAEKITGIARPQRPKVTHISSKRPVDFDAVAQRLAGIEPDGLTPAAALDQCSELLEIVAASNGEADVFVLDQIRAHFGFTQAFMKPFQHRLRAYRQGLGGAKTEKKLKKGAEAPRSLYLELYPKFAGRIRRDIFSNKLYCFSEHDDIWYPLLNEENLLRSRFREYGEQHDIRFSMSAVRDHLEELKHGMRPELCVDLPAWDGHDYIGDLMSRIKVREVSVEGGAITREVLTEFMRDWHARMWLRLEDPSVQNRIIVLKGGQGIGKDTWVDEHVGALGQWKVPFRIFKNEKDTYEQLHNGLCMHIEEFDKTGRTEVSLLKDILTSPATMFRAAYAAAAEYRHVRCSFIATCNVDDILRDYTGNRRYVVFEVEDIDRSRRLSRIERLQVLAQGKALAQERKFAGREAEALMASYLSEHTPVNPADEAVRLWDEYASGFVEERNNSSGPALRFTSETRFGKFEGFLANRYSGSIIDKIARDLGTRPQAIRTFLKKAHRVDMLKREHTVIRGYYYGVKESFSGSGDIEGSRRDNFSEVTSEDIPF